MGTGRDEPDRAGPKPTGSPWALLTRKPVRTRGDYQGMLLGGIGAATISGVLLVVIAVYGLPPVKVPAAAPVIPGLFGLMLVLGLGEAGYAGHRIRTAPLRDPTITPEQRESAASLAKVLVATQGAVFLAVAVGLLVTGRLYPGVLSLFVAALSSALLFWLRRSDETPDEAPSPPASRPSA